MKTTTRRLLTCGLVCLLPLLAQGSGSYGSRAPRTKSSKATATAHPSGERTLLNLDRKGVALQGHDPVSLFTDGSPVKGDPQFQAEHGGAIYHFASRAHLVSFQASPDKYIPQFGGFCAMGVAMGKLLKVDVAVSQVVNGRLLAQKNAKARDMFNQDPTGNLQKADAQWPGLVERKGR
jgi:YHS domain-containing protein